LGIESQKKAQVPNYAQKLLHNPEMIRGEDDENSAAPGMDGISPMFHGCAGFGRGSVHL
jgi:hypothetical protein